MFDNLKTDNDIQEQGDSLGGARVLDSGLYDMVIDIAYFDKSSGGAMSMNFVFTDGSTEVKQTVWITSGDAKGNKNFYTDSSGTKQYLPGFNIANAICLLTVGKELADVASTTEKKVIKLYNYTEKKELPTEVTMATELLGKPITIGLIKQIVDKNVKDASGNYVPSGDTREENEVDRVFRQSDKMTVAEIKAKEDSVSFYEAWSSKWNGQVRDKSTKVDTGAVAGAPAAQESTESLFQ